jgi:hypothetical protein
MYTPHFDGGRRRGVFEVSLQRRRKYDRTKRFVVSFSLI